jgi:hypothetical protein
MSGSLETNNPLGELQHERGFKQEHAWHMAWQRCRDNTQRGNFIAMLMDRADAQDGAARAMVGKLMQLWVNA